MNMFEQHDRKFKQESKRMFRHAAWFIPLAIVINLVLLAAGVAVILLVLSFFGVL